MDHTTAADSAVVADNLVGSSRQTLGGAQDVAPVLDQIDNMLLPPLGPETLHTRNIDGSRATRGTGLSIEGSTTNDSGATSSTGVASQGRHHHGTGWQRVHHAISAMSVQLQRRRLNLLTGSTSAFGRPKEGRSTGWQQELVQRGQPLHSGNCPQQAELQTQKHTFGDEDPSLAAPPCPAPVGGVSPYGASVVESNVASCAESGRLGSELQLLEVVGCGSFGTVYRAAWRGKTVAVKLVHVPKSSGELLHGWGDKGVGKALADQLRDESKMSQDKAERMALIEAVVSMSMQHPNIVRVYRYEIHPLSAEAWDSGLCQRHKGVKPGALARGASEGLQQEVNSLGWELRLVMEYCSQVRCSLDPCLSCFCSYEISAGVAGTSDRARCIGKFPSLSEHKAGLMLNGMSWFKSVVST
jgi:hypothetical protein